MDIAYVTLFYTPEPYKDLARFMDWVHALRDMDKPAFNFEVHTYVATNTDSTVFSPPPHYLGSPNSLFPSPKNNFEGILNIPRLKSDIERQSPDIVHLNSINIPILSLLKSLNTETKTVIGPSIGGWYPGRRPDLWLTSRIETIKKKLEFRLRKKLLQLANPNLLVSFTKYHKDLLKSTGISSDKIEPLKPGVSSIFYPKNRNLESSEFRLLYIGWLGNSHKGYKLFLHALSTIENATAYIVGGGDPRRDLIERLGLCDRVEIKDFVPRIELPELYNDVDLTVVPSTDETGGTNVQFESLACGTPVVVTDEPGMNEYAHPDSVVYFSPRTADSLASAIQKARDNLPLLAATAEEHAGRYQSTHTVKQLEEIYTELL